MIAPDLMSLARLAEAVDEAIGLAAYLGLEHAEFVGVGRIGEQRALRLEDEAGGLEVGLDDLRIDPVQLFDDGAMPTTPPGFTAA